MADDSELPAVRQPVARHDPGALTPAGIALAFTGVGKVFPDGTEALRDISFTVGEGEFVAVVGPSGSGKSTLLRIASALTEPSYGTVVVSTAVPGYVFQDPTLLPWRSVEGNVGLLAQLDGVPRPERRRLVAEAISLAGLTGFERHRPRALSGGMRMRVSLARALTVRPSLFLFDEPFGALDEITRQRLGQEVLRLYGQERFASLFVTHSVVESVWLASRVVVLSTRPGRVLAEIDVPFDYPRQVELRFDAAFGRTARTVSEALRESFA
ncbi:ABC transporter ATP-binding protein [Protofrankia coriariae]|uniref:Sulfate ABC transporter ATP-binding protein n=1 Tax=Protofrankia coriariae TaxID=1562887 RepID=A0ABR5F2N2_9ACTN|nr:ABC transporter ATP-binding protein [Protofrankia coriariae]KLL10925.1 sulfate ABC transporter ATP-binding protein [Protofrankia coriariae]